MLPLTLADFNEAAARIADKVHRTPVQRATLLGREIGAQLHIKCESFQKTGSFKARGALNKLLQLDRSARERGVITVSAGNHAQALAWAASVTQIPSTVIMPAKAAKIKTEATAAYGAEVILHGTVHDLFDKARELERERNLTFIHPFDDPQIIAGAGSAGLEILEQCPGVTTIVAPIGGGGHIAGVAGAAKMQSSRVRVFGVEPEGASTMRQSLDAGHAVHADSVDTIADGLAPPMAGELNYEFVKACVEDVVLVTDEEIVRAMALLFSRTKLVAEPAGAAALAALLAGRVPLGPTDVVVAVLSGGNISPRRFAELVGETASTT
jgi:threonine dehydratase